MKEYILLLPIIFIIHDMEEVVGFGRFFRDNPYLFDKYSNVTKAYRGFTTEGFAAAVYEEFIPFFGVSLTAYFYPCRFLYALWFGLFISLTAHFFIHIGQAIYLKKYIPSFATSVIGLPVSILILIKCTAYISFDLVSILIMATGIIFMIVNLKIAHILMHRVNKAVMMNKNRRNDNGISGKRSDMRIIIINGSPRVSGITATTLHMLEKELMDNGMEVGFYNLSEMEMSHCLGCCSCYKTGHCCIRDDAEKLSDEIAEADGVILGSPTYASNVSGLMKDFIDRGHFVIEQLLHGKHCVIVATGENYGNRDAAKVLKNLVIYSGGRLSGSIVFNSPFNSRDFEKEKLYGSSRKAALKMIKAIRGKKIFPIQSMIHFIVLNLGIRPFVRKKGKL